MSIYSVSHLLLERFTWYILGVEGVLYTEATDRRGLDRERAKRLHQKFGLTQKWDREELSRSLSNGAIAASSGGLIIMYKDSEK